MKHKKLFKLLSRKKPGEVDALFQDTHQEVFACMDCLECANCCTTTGPRFTDKDVVRISKHLKLKPTDFINKYLKVDEDGDQVLQNVPCTFLGSDNYCSIYDVRPKACAEYPHTDRVKQKQLFTLTEKNVEICPAVSEILEKIEVKIGGVRK